MRAHEHKNPAFLNVFLALPLELQLEQAATAGEKPRTPEVLEIVVVLEVGVRVANQAEGASQPEHKTASKTDPTDEEVDREAEASSCCHGGLGPEEVGHEGHGQPKRNQCDPEKSPHDHSRDRDKSSFQRAGKE